MGASQDKNKRDTSGFDLNTSKNRQKKDDERAKKTARTAIITVIVVAVLFIGALFINSNYLRQNLACVRIDGVKYSITDFSYNYQNLYAQYYSSMSGSGSDFTNAMLPEQGKSLKSQIYDEDTGETWAEFFQKMTIEQLKQDNTILVAAMDAGYQLTDEDKAAVDDEIENVRTSSSSYGYPDLDSYLKAMYGKGMNEKAFREAVERTYLITSYTNYINDSFTYTQDDLENYYTENRDKLDTFTYRYFHISAGDIKKADYDTDEEYNAAKEAAIDDTEQRAQDYLAEITDEASFIETAREYDPEMYAEDDSSQRSYQGELLGATYGDWLKDSARQEGDVSTFRSSNGTYVVYYGTRSDNHYNTTDVRVILCPPETVNADDYADDETTDAYDAAVEAARAAAEKTANDILAVIDSQDDKEAAFIDQTDFYNGTIQIDSDKSGLLEKVYKDQMPETVNDWIFDSARQTGDYKLIYAEDVGYYLVYFAGTDDLYSNILSDTKLRQEDLQAWKDSLEVSDAKVTWLMTLV